MAVLAHKIDNGVVHLLVLQQDTVMTLCRLDNDHLRVWKQVTDSFYLTEGVENVGLDTCEFWEEPRRGMMGGRG